MRCRLIVLVALVAIAIGVAPRAAVAVSLKEEIDLGKKIDVEILKQNQLYADDKAQHEMDEYGQKLAKYVSRPQIPYHFRILKDNEFNAFSTPGGYVYFTDRLWRVLRTDERIGVIGHEITHVDQRHAIDAMLKAQKRQTVLAILLAATKAGDLMYNVASMAESMYAMKYSRGDEQMADYGAVYLCQKAGYNPTGILLAMYKIGRFESESGGAPPKIFSDHPPTKERLQYLKQLLASKGVTVPPENIQSATSPYRVGDVLSAEANSLTFTSTKPLKTGDVVWVMRNGWDFYYEKQSAVPAARAVVTGNGTNPTASFWVIPGAKATQPAKGMGVYAPPLPAAEKGVGTMISVSRQAAIGRLRLDTPATPYERLLAVQAVWNKDNTQLVNDYTGYLVVTNPASETGYVGANQSKFAYAPMESNSVLVKVNDPDAKSWIGPVVSIGRSGGTIEVKTTRKVSKNAVYDVLYPAWNRDAIYAKRLIGTAKLDSTSPKLVLKMVSFSGGWTANDIQNGFDVYEQKQASK